MLEQDDRVGPQIDNVIFEIEDVVAETTQLSETFDNFVTRFDFKPDWGVEESPAERIHPE